MNQALEVITFVASEDWSADDLQKFLHQLNILYNRLYVLQKIKESGRAKNLRNALYGSLSLIDEPDLLVIESIVIQSPAKFSLRGCGEPLREIRELIKDFAFRNRQERQKGEEELRHQKEINTLREIYIKETLSQQVNKMKELNYEQEQINIGIKALGDPLDELNTLSVDKNIKLK